MLKNNLYIPAVVLTFPQKPLLMQHCKCIDDQKKSLENKAEREHVDINRRSTLLLAEARQPLYQSHLHL